MLSHHPSPLPHWHRKLLQTVRFPFWFACLLAVAGTAWRPPLASVGLVLLFLGLLIGIEWTSRRLIQKKGTKTESAESEEIIVYQQMTRSTTAQGADRLDGTLWAEFPEDAMTTTVHIPFCPAFERVPKVHVFPADGTDVQFRVMPQKTFGVRIDVKRSNRETDRIRFVITAEG